MRENWAYPAAIIVGLMAGRQNIGEYDNLLGLIVALNYLIISILLQAKLLAKILLIKYIIVFKSVCHQGRNEEP